MRGVLIEPEGEDSEDRERKALFVHYFRLQHNPVHVTAYQTIGAPEAFQLFVNMGPCSLFACVVTSKVKTIVLNKDALRAAFRQWFSQNFKGPVPTVQLRIWGEGSVEK